MKTGRIMEDGDMRGMFAAGVTDVMLETGNPVARLGAGDPVKEESYASVTAL